MVTMKANRVLIADDDPSIRRLLATLVRREGFEADVAVDGEEAIELLGRGHYKIILLDLMMPRVNGFGVVEHLRTHQSDSKPLVFVISAYADQMYREVDTSVVSGVLHKPFDVTEVASLVKHVMRGWDRETVQVLKNSRERSLREFLETTSGLNDAGRGSH